MVYYDVLGFSTFDEYRRWFFDNLLPTNQTYDFFVDWNKVKGNVKGLVKEISLLNALCKVKRDERERLLKDILGRYPEVLPVIPLIIAVRDKELHLVELSNMIIYKTYNFERRKLNPDEIEDLVNFCKHTGILDLFDEINDLYAYLLGVEVGLDSNARKNRSGKIYEGIIHLLLSKILKNVSGRQSFRYDIGRNVRLHGIKKKIDFLISINGEPRIAIECNFYNVTGSKPTEIARAYIELERELEKRGLTLIWITDGPAWRRMKDVLVQAMREMKYVLNTKMIERSFERVLAYELAQVEGN